MTSPNDRMRAARSLLPYGVALGAVVAVVFLRWVLTPWLGHAFPYVTAFAGVAVAVWYGGLGPGIFATVAAFVGCQLTFVVPEERWTSPRELTALALYLFTCAIIVVLGEGMRKARRRADEGHELLAVTFRSIGDAVITTDARGRVHLLNTVAETLTGWKQDEARGRPLEEVFRIVSELTRLPVETPVGKVLAHGRTVGLANHTVLIGRHGAESPIDDSAAPILDHERAIVGCVLVFRDISERRSLEARDKERLATARMLAAIVESSEDAIISKSLNGEIRTWNTAAERLFGYTAQEAIGKHITLMIPDDRLQEEPQIIAQLQQGIRVDHFETLRRCKDGRLIPISLTISPITDETGRVVAASKIARDVSARIRSEQELRDNQERLRLATQTGKVGIWEWDVVADRVAWTDSLFEVYGIDKTRFAANGAAFFALVHRDDLERVLQAHEEALAGLRPYEVEFRSVRPDGRTIWVYTNAVVVREDGAPRKMVGATLDITDRKHAEDARVEADRRKDEFLATLAHELRNPLAPIRNATQLFRLKNLSDPELRWSSEVIERQVRHMSRLLDDLLDVSRISRQRLVLRKERVDVATVIQSAIETSRPWIDAGEHELDVRLPVEPVAIEADPVRIAQVVSNLLNNASKFMGPGGLIHLGASKQGEQAVISVRDEGIGITEELMPRLFENFSQGSPALERSQGGLGIGLSLARAIVELHDGTIEVRSAGQGRGSEFVVRLPVSKRPAQPPLPAPAHRPAQDPALRRRILVVDDLEESADSMALLLQVLGHEVRQAYDGEGAVIAAEQMRPDIVLLDIGMPKLNGYDVCRRLRAQPWGRSMTILAVTGWGQEADRKRSEEAGFDGHLVKPVDPDGLETWISNARN